MIYLSVVWLPKQHEKYTLLFLVSATRHLCDFVNLLEGSVLGALWGRRSVDLTGPDHGHGAEEGQPKSEHSESGQAFAEKAPCEEHREECRGLVEQ